MKTASLSIAIVLASATLANANVIERACNRSPRDAANRSLCSCIQDVADLTLNKRDQSAAARFFKDPQKAQDLRQANGSANEQFWKRYKEFGNAARGFCSPTS